MSEAPHSSSDINLGTRLERLEARLTRIEDYLDLPRSESQAANSATKAVQASASRTEDEFELKVGQDWFAKSGVVVLAIGIAFTLSLPYANLPAAIPALAGYAAAAGFFILSYLWRRSFEIVAKYSRGVGMALFYFATLRMYFFGSAHVLNVDSLLGKILLLSVVAINLVIAFGCRSPYLFNLALATGYISAFIIGSAWWALCAILLLSVLAAYVYTKYSWLGPFIFGILCGYAAYFVWATHAFAPEQEFHFASEPRMSPAFPLACAIILAIGSLRRKSRPQEDARAVACALLNSGGAYGLFLLHTLASFEPIFVAAHLAAFLVFLGLAVVFWVRESARFSTFVYAMTGYLALSFAIIKAAPMPDVFVWLSLQSIVVVATAIWFRSRFIVVTNFVIYVLIVIGYMLLAHRETGISLGFGIVALLSARILNWQKSRLELKTEIMRNAYLFSAFIIFPYALYHLAPPAYVGLTWMGLALFYYSMNLIIQNRKYRWMGHCTLLLTAAYLLVMGISHLEAFYRNASFLILGAILVAISLAFTRSRVRRYGQKK